jgi:hypothetical protein
MKKPLYVNISGGLGNQLFMFATALSLSLQWSRKLVLINSWYSGQQRGESYSLHRRTFDLFDFPLIATQFRATNRIESKVISILERIHFGHRIDLSFFGFRNLDEVNSNISTECGTFLYGYMQEPNHFIHIFEELKNLIKLSEKCQKNAIEFIEKYRVNTERLIAVHVRRGDYAHPDMFGCLLTGEYFRNALKNFNLEVSKILIFSDSPEWCEQDPFLSQFQVVKEPSATNSLVMMSLCDDFIVSPSTFSWWGACLGVSDKKVVVAPEPYNQFDTKIWEQFVQKDWIREPAIFEKQ